MIHCILIDDETNSLEMMEWLLKTYCPQVRIDAMCQSAEEGIKAIHQFHPDVIFLDIEMPHRNGFDMLEQFDKLFFLKLYSVPPMTSLPSRHLNTAHLIIYSNRSTQKI